MKPKMILAIAMVLSLSATAVQAMDVPEFLATAAGIPRNPTALLRSDTRRLMREVRAALQTIRTDDKAALAAGRPPVTCTPETVSIDAMALLARFETIPVARRNISVTQAMREWMADRYPCPAT